MHSSQKAVQEGYVPLILYPIDALWRISFDASVRAPLAPKPNDATWRKCSNLDICIF